MHNRKLKLSIAVLALFLLQTSVQAAFGFGCVGDNAGSIYDRHSDVQDTESAASGMVDCHNEGLSGPDGCCQDCFGTQMISPTARNITLPAEPHRAIAAPSYKYQAYLGKFLRPPRLV